MTRLLPLVLLAAVLVGFAAPAVACPSCAEAGTSVMANDDDPAAVAAAQRQGQKIRGAYEWSIVLMLVSVLSLVGFVVTMVVRVVRRIDAQHAVAPASSNAPPT